MTSISDYGRSSFLSLCSTEFGSTSAAQASGHSFVASLLRGVNCLLLTSRCRISSLSTHPCDC